MVVTISPSFSLYRMVVFPAASKPTETDQTTVSLQLAFGIKSTESDGLSGETPADRRWPTAATVPPGRSADQEFGDESDINE